MNKTFLLLVLLFCSSTAFCSSRTFLLQRIINADIVVKGHEEVLNQKDTPNLRYCKDLGKFSESIFGLISVARDLDVESGAFYRPKLSDAESYRAQLSSEADKLNQFCEGDFLPNREAAQEIISNTDNLRENLLKSIFQNN